MKKYLLILLISAVSISLTNAQIVFDEIGVGTSYWIRTYSTPDENVLLTNPPTANGESNPVIVPHLYGRVKLGSFLGLRGKVGLAQDNYTSSVVLGNLTRNEKISQTIIPVGLLLDFSLPLGLKSGKQKKSIDENTDVETVEKVEVKSKISLVGGLGLNRYFIQNTFTREIIGGEGSLPESKFTGNDYGFTAMLGISKQVSEKILLTLFSQYNSGSYDNRVYSEEVSGTYNVNKISLNGFEFGISLGYKFGN